MILSPLSGDMQQGVVGRLLEAPLVISVADENGLPLAGVAVSFYITEGCGRVQPWEATTGSSGQVSVPLVLGSHSGPTVVQASAERSPGSCSVAPLALADIPAPIPKSLPGSWVSGVFTQVDTVLLGITTNWP